MPGFADGWPLAIVESLVAASIRGGLVVLVVWVVCRQSGALRASTCAALWWTAALALLVPLLPLPAISVPVLPPAPAAVARSNGSDGGLSRRGSADAADATAGWTEWPARAPARPAGDASASAGAPERAWPLVLAAIWLSGLVFALAHVLVAHRRMRGVIERSSPADEATDALAARTAAALGMSGVPPVRTSHEIGSPLVAGVWHPVILLPAAAATWPERDLAMALCHELVHVQRRDLLLGWVPLLAERLLFFHPLAHVAAREYAIAREAACDAAVVHTIDVEPQQYGRLLMRIGVVRRQPVVAASGAAMSRRALRRRLEMLNDHSSRRAMRGSGWIFAAVLCLAVLPVQLVSAIEGSADRVAFTPVPVPLTFAPDVTPVPPPVPLLLAALPGMAQDQAPGIPVPRPDGSAPPEPAPVQPGTEERSSPAEAPPDDDFHAWVRRTQQTLREMAAGTVLWDDHRHGLIQRELEAILRSLQVVERMLVAPAQGWGGWWTPADAGAERARLQQSIRFLEQELEALTRAQEGFIKAREALARQQEDLTRRQEELRERQRALMEQLDQD